MDMCVDTTQPSEGSGHGDPGGTGGGSGSGN